MYQIALILTKSLLTDPSGKVHPEITNKNGNPNYKYFYSNADQGIPIVPID